MSTHRGQLRQLGVDVGARDHGQGGRVVGVHAVADRDRAPGPAVADRARTRSHRAGRGRSTGTSVAPHAGELRQRPHLGGGAEDERRSGPDRSSQSGWSTTMADRRGDGRLDHAGLDPGGQLTLQGVAPQLPAAEGTVRAVTGWPRPADLDGVELVAGASVCRVVQRRPPHRRVGSVNARRAAASPARGRASRIAVARAQVGGDEFAEQVDVGPRARAGCRRCGRRARRRRRRRRRRRPAAGRAGAAAAVDDGELHARGVAGRVFHRGKPSSACTIRPGDVGASTRRTADSVARPAAHDGGR